MTFALRPYQHNACEAALEWLKRSIDPCVIDAAPAAGKSYMIAHIANALHQISGGKRVLCLAPSAELVRQNHGKFILTGEPASIFSASAGAKSTRHVVVFGTPLTVKNAISRFCRQGKEGFCAVIIDECFTGETLISTPRGDIPIRNLRTGDIVCNAVGSGEVETVFTKAVAEVYDVALSDGTVIRCTGSHPFFTDRGWVQASELEREGLFRKEDVSRMLDDFRAKVAPHEEQGWEPTRKHEPNDGGQLEQARNLFSILREEMEEPHAQRFVSFKDEGHVEAYRAQAASEMGKWMGDDCAAGSTSRNTREWVGRGASDTDYGWPQERGLPERIQGGLGLSGDNGCHRGGWREPWNSSPSGRGQKERCLAGIVGVESISRVELESPEVVYNLHVSGHPSYFAGGVLVHNCHGITPTTRSIIEAMREANPNLRVVGLSGTPYRLGTGYVYRIGPDDRTHGDDVCRDPYFMKCVYRVSSREMLDQQFITPMTIGAINAEHYDTSGIELLPNGTLNPDTVERAFVGHGRQTSAIVGDVLDKARARPGGIMYFAATVRHAHEVLASLPQGSSGLVTGDDCVLGTGDSIKRDRLIAMYREGDIRHLVSVGTLTTGFDVSHTEVIALLRYTESAALLQQILGRAWRLHPGKADCLLLDYAENIERHFPDGDIYNPAIKAGPAGGTGDGIEAKCEGFEHVNTFGLNADYAEYARDEYGYCLDVFGARIETEYGPMPAHYGRRCMGMVQAGEAGQYERCNYRWTGKDCPECGEKNDIAARYCYVCKAEIVNPNDKLVADFKALKKDPTRLQTDQVLSVTFRPGISTKGNETVRADWVTPYRQFSTWHMPGATHTKGMREWAAFKAATENATTRPATITYVKDDSGFFRITAYDCEADALPDELAERQAA